MAGICCGGVVGETETSTAVEPSSRSSRRRRIDIMQAFKFVADVAVPLTENNRKRPKLSVLSSTSPPSTRECINAIQSCETEMKEEKTGSDAGKIITPTLERDLSAQGVPKFGMTSVCGRRRDMEDAVAIHPSFCRRDSQIPTGFHFFGVYDGHGCSHVAFKCKARMHEIVKEELESCGESWKEAMERSFLRMDKEVNDWSDVLTSKCRCELQTPQCDAVGSTAVVAVVTPDKIIVSNCGDSRAVLCRSGVAVQLSDDHKEDEIKKGELEADKDRMMREYRAQLDAERASKLAHGRNHSKTKSHHKKDRKDKDSKKRSSKKRKHSRRSSESSSSSSSSESSSSDDEERESRRSKSRSKRTKKEKRHRSRTKHFSTDEESEGPVPLSKFFGVKG